MDDRTLEYTLCLAAASGDINSVKVGLRDSGCGVNARDGEGRTLLHWATFGHPDTVKALLDMGANVHAEDNDKQTPLHCAAGHGHADTIDILVGKGARVNAADNVGRTAAHIAVADGNVDMVAALRDHGSDMKARDNNGRTPLYEATTSEMIWAVKGITVESKRQGWAARENRSNKISQRLQ